MQAIRHSSTAATAGKQKMLRALRFIRSTPVYSNFDPLSSTFDWLLLLPISFEVKHGYWQVRRSVCLEGGRLASGDYRAETERRLFSTVVAECRAPRCPARNSRN